MRPRIVTAEILDGLPEVDQSAQRSRRDLQRIHRAMGTSRLVAGTLQSTRVLRRDSAPLRILEIGAGDGHLMLTVARRLRASCPKVELTLLDRLNLVSKATRAAYAEVGWSTAPLIVDILEWAAGGAAARFDLIIANLFLHHFEPAQLRALLSAIAVRTPCFVAFEPRRSWFASAASHLVGVIGANSVTRTDAILSVDAGFRDREITALWPAGPARWQLEEHASGLFSHCFVAERLSEPAGVSHATGI